MKFFALAACLAVATAAHADYPFSVKVVGHGKPVILIPGLACTGDVWNTTVDHLKGKYECHVLTLAGFGKQAPVVAPFLTQVRDGIIAYVHDKHLKQPAVIGHSLGGFMTYSLGIAEPKLFGPLIAVDGVPWLIALQRQDAKVDAVKGQAEMIGKMMATEPKEQFETGIRAALTGQITDPKNVEIVYATSKDSDQATVGRAVQEMFLTDLRAEVSKVESPLLLIAAGQSATNEEGKKALESAYRSQISPIKKGKLAVSWKARHFIMLDDSEFFFSTIDSFLMEGWQK